MNQGRIIFYGSTVPDQFGGRFPFYRDNRAGLEMRRNGADN